ncbi:MAG: hypothetical protein ACK55Z_19340 [bacterium]
MKTLFITSYECQLTEKVRKVGKNDVKRSANQGSILARVKGQGALLARWEEGGAQGVSQHVQDILACVGAEERK